MKLREELEIVEINESLLGFFCDIEKIVDEINEPEINELMMRQFDFLLFLCKKVPPSFTKKIPKMISRALVQKLVTKNVGELRKELIKLNEFH